MLDLKMVRENPEAISKKLKHKGFNLDLNKYNQLEAKRKELQVKTENLQHARNDSSKKIGIAKGKGEPVNDIIQEISSLGSDLDQAKHELENIQHELNNILISMPNIAHDSVVIGKSDLDNQEIRKWGTIPKFNFIPKHHYELTEETSDDCLDFTRASKLSGSRFVVIKGKIAKLHRALAQFMLDLHTEKHGYSEVNVPILANSKCFYGTGQFPKFTEDQFGIQDSDLWLIPTSEVSVTNLHRDEILTEAELPKKYACFSPCFRKEAGSYGKDERGMFRQHQFEKVELVQIVKAQDSYHVLEEITGHAEAILQALELPYRLVSLCTGDLGFSAAKTYDLEVWLPGQNCYREISSCSNFEAFQSRRMQIRYRNQITNKPELLHTLNGSGLAIGRTLIAVMENYQSENNRIKIPKVLQKYVGTDLI